MRLRLVTVLVSAVLLASCAMPGPVPARQSPTAIAPSPTEEGPTELERQLTAQVMGLLSMLMWAPNGKPAPMVLTHDTVTVGDKTTNLDLPGVTVALYGTFDNQCMEGRVSSGGDNAVTAVYGVNLTGILRSTAPGKTCADVAPDFPLLTIPHENFPGVNGFESILVSTGTCVDFVFWDTSYSEPLEIPVVRDCAGPHEYVIVEVDPLELADGASDSEIEDAAEELCVVAVRRWELSSGRTSIGSWYWFPTAVTFAEGERLVNCFAQVTEDAEQRTDGSDLFPS